MYISLLCHQSVIVPFTDLFARAKAQVQGIGGPHATLSSGSHPIR